ncbi:MAG: FecR family protein, partial [Terriglobales bacterium]
LLNAPVVEAEKIRTGGQGEAEIQLECGSALRLTPDSELAVPHLRLRDDGVRSTTLRVDAGTMYFTLQRGDSHDFHVELPGGEIETLDGAASLRLEAPASADATVELLDGRAELVAGKHRYKLQRLERVQLQPGGKVGYLQPARSDHWMQWSHGRDQAFLRAEMASQPQPFMDAASSAPTQAAPPTGTDKVPDAKVLFNNLDAEGLDSLTSTMAGRPSPRTVPSCVNH